MYKNILGIAVLVLAVGACKEKEKTSDVDNLAPANSPVSTTFADSNGNCTTQTIQDYNVVLNTCEHTGSAETNEACRASIRDFIARYQGISCQTTVFILSANSTDYPYDSTHNYYAIGTLSSSYFTNFLNQVEDDEGGLSSF